MGVAHRLALLGALALPLAVGCGRGAPSPREGRRLFAASCARCHGVDGTGGRPLAPGRPPPRDFHDPEFQRTRTDADLRATIAAGRGLDMPPFRTVYDARQIDALVGRVRSFRAR